MECAPKVTFATDSALEGDGFEPSVPREGPTRRDGFIRLSQRRLGSAPSAVGDLNHAIWAAISAGTITSATTTTASAADGGCSKRRLSRRGPMVRIHLPPAVSR